MYKYPSFNSEGRIGEVRNRLFSIYTLIIIQLSANSVFGAVHLAILGLSARCIALGKPFVQIVPHTEVETKLSQQYAPGVFHTLSRFGFH